MDSDYFGASAYEDVDEFGLNIERDFTQFLDHLPVAVFIVDGAGNPVFANKECVRISGMGADGKARGHLSETYGVTRRGTEDPYPEHELPLVRALGGVAVSATDLDIAGPSGRVPVDAVGSPIFDEAGNVKYAMCVFEDVSAKIQAEAERLQSQKLESVGQLAAGIAHEINTPMQYIGDNAHFLKKVLPNLLELIDHQAQLIESIASADQLAAHDALTKKLKISRLRKRITASVDATIDGVDAVSVLVRSMKEFSHPGESDMASTDINHAIEMALAVSRNEWKYVADIERDLDPELPELRAMRGELNQVFLNLIVNGAHAIAERGAEEKGVLRVKTRVVGASIEVSISDNGAGIPDAVKAKIYDPFFTTKGVGKGTGQGLAIARSIVVDKHSGNIEVDSTEGQGTTFRLCFPLTSAVEMSSPS